MRQFKHHTDEEVCPGCEDRLTDGHSYMVRWFNQMKANNPKMHASWVFRDEAAQHQAVIDGKSKLDWPKSMHNNTKDGKPYSLAIDIFQQVNGRAVFDPMFCARVNAATQKAGFSIRWGAAIKSLGDYDHFEMIIDEQKSEEHALDSVA
jgi:hypothetical protein